MNNIKLLLTGALSGISNGLFGAGGGILTVLALKRIMNQPPKEAHAGAISIVLPMCVVSISVYLINGVELSSNLIPILPSFAAGSIIGAVLLGKLKNNGVERIFNVVMLIAAVRMLFP